MWEPKQINKSSFGRSVINAVLEGTIPAIIIKKFYGKKDCEKIVYHIKEQKIEEFEVDRLNHLGTFLMAHTTNKKQYFEEAKKDKKIFRNIFRQTENPIEKIHKTFQEIFPDYVVGLANEENKAYSECIIRIHQKGKKIPIHKDNVSYEGKEFAISKIDNQLSCVLHLQKSEVGGELTVYKKQWTKKDEKNREITFGYSNKVISNKEKCEISNIEQGDLVIINPNYFHSVSEITGETPRITLGMFLGISINKMKIVSWA